MMKQGRPAEYLCHMSVLGYDAESCSHLMFFHTWLTLNKNWIYARFVSNPLKCKTLKSAEGATCFEGYVFKDSGCPKTGIFPDLDLSRKDSLGES